MKVLLKKFAAAISVAVAAVFIGAFSGCTYTPVYDLEACSPSGAYLPDAGRPITFNRMYRGQGYTLYIDSELTDGEAIDGHIADLNLIFDIIAQRSAELPAFESADCYISADLISGFEAEHGKTVSLTAGIPIEEAFAWVLSAVFANSDLPYGAYAGLAALWLSEGGGQNFELLPHGQITESYLTELQFPLYVEGELSPEQRSFAWNFSYTLARDWENGGHSPLEFEDLSAELFNSFLEQTYGLSLPQYTFTPYSSQYEYRVVWDSIRFYIDRQFTDALLPEEHFSTRYDCLAAWLKDNINSAALANELFGVDDIPYIVVYLESSGESPVSNLGDVELNLFYPELYCYTAGAFSAGYVAHALYSTGKDGYLAQMFTDFLSQDSYYTNLACYYLYSGNAEDYNYLVEGEYDQRAQFMRAMELYNGKSPTPASPQNFNYWLYCDCITYVMLTEELAPSSTILQFVSELHYIALNYGNQALLDLNEGIGEIGDKTISEIDVEWQTWLFAQFE